MKAVEDFVPFAGQHCETMATGNLLKHAGLKLSEPMLFGLGEGLAYAMFNMKNMPAPFIGGRPRPDEVTHNLVKNLGVQVDFRKTGSKKRAWQNVASFIDAGQPVAVRVNSYYLDYFTNKIHFGGHYVALHGYDGEFVYVVDTQQQGGNLRTNRENFEEGRLWKGPMAPKGITWTISLGEQPIDWPKALRRAIVANATSYLNPPIKNFGAVGIRKTAKVLPTWFGVIDSADIHLVGMLMEQAGTGGSLFRNFYRDFLMEANDYLQSPAVATARDQFAQVAPLWQTVANHLMATPDVGIDALHAAVPILEQIADLEEMAVMELLGLESADKKAKLTNFA